MNSRPSTPLCQNCLKSRLYCEAVRDDPGYPRTCCASCEHYDLPVDIRTGPKVTPMKG